MASVLLVAAGTGAAQALVTAVRAMHRARDAAGAEALVAARLDGWSPAPCAAAAGARVIGARREWWTVTVGGGLATLVDSVGPADGGAGARAGGARVAPCVP